MKDTVYEIFNIPVTTKNVYDMYKYVLDNNKMNQELFDLCFKNGLTKVFYAIGNTKEDIVLK